MFDLCLMMQSYNNILNCASFYIKKGGIKNSLPKLHCHKQPNFLFAPKDCLLFPYIYYRMGNSMIDNKV